VTEKKIRSCRNKVYEDPSLYKYLYTYNQKTHEDLQMNTVLNEIKKWNTKYLRKLENHTNALAVNLIDNSETTHILKRYTVLTLPDRPE
jgi:hypothetical protein